MADDELLRSLGAAQREEEAAVRAEGGTPDEPWAPALEPFSGRERERLLDDVFSSLDGDADADTGQTQADTEPGDGAAEGAVDPSSPAGAKVVTMRRRAVIVAVLAAAAVLALWLGLRDRDATVVASLPEYEVMRLQGGIAEQRGDEPTRLRMAPDATIDWILTPVRPTTEAVGLAILARPSGGGPALFARADAEVSATGSVRLQGKLSDTLSLRPGRWQVTLIVAPDADLPADANAATRAGPWRTESFEVEIVGPDSK